MKPLHKSYGMMQFKIYIVLTFLAVKNVPALANRQKSIQQFYIFERKKIKTKQISTDLLNVATKPFFLFI